MSIEEYKRIYENIPVQASSKLTQHSFKYQKCNDINFLSDLKIYIYQQFVQ